MGIEEVKKLELKKYDIVWFDLGENIGSVQSKKRPCVILSNNDNSPVCIIAPMTTKKFNRKLRIHVTLDSYNGKKCNILFEQLKVISKTQILRKMEPINDKKIQAEINNCIKYVLQV